MPWADSAATARRWATDRAIDGWVLVAGDVPTEELAELTSGLLAAKGDGASILLVVPPGITPAAAEKAISTVVAKGAIEPAPEGIFAAIVAAGLCDARRVGVVGRSAAVVSAGLRAGAGAVIALAPAAAPNRLALLRAQPDAVIEPREFGGFEAERYGSHRALRQRVLLNPGPAVVSDRVHRRIGGPDLCHREPEATKLFERVRHKLRWAADVPDTWAVVLLAGSGTAALEAMTGAFVRPDRRLLVCRNGTYGDRIAEIADRMGIDAKAISAATTVPIDPQAVAAALDADPTIDAVAIVHHETTTGLLNPVEAIARIAGERGVLTLVDAISSLGAETLDLAGSGIDAVAGTANKCLHGLPGVSFVLLSPRAQERIHAVQPRSLYLDLRTYLAAQERGSVPFTPSIPAIYGLDAALDELAEEGREARRDRYRERMAVLDTELERLGLDVAVAPEHRSSSVRSMALLAGVAYPALHDALRAEGYVIYAGLGPAASSSFRVCLLGNVEVDAVRGFVTVLERTLGDLGRSA